MARPRDLATILFRPRDTFRRVLDAPARWWWQIAVATAIATSIDDADFNKLRTAFPFLRVNIFLPIAIGAFVVVAAARVFFIWAAAWITYGAGRLLGGTAPVRDLYA